MDQNETDSLAPVEQGTVLLLQVPRTNEKKELAAEQMLASLHGLLLSTERRRFGHVSTRERLSFEIAVKDKRIGFYVWVPNYLKSFVEEQIYAQYPTVHISEVPDYTMSGGADMQVQLAADMKLTAHDALPLKTFPSFEVDPLASITATLAQFEDDEEAWLQIVLRPAPNTWYKHSERYVAKIRSGGGMTKMGMLGLLWAPPGEGGAGAAKLAEHQSARANAAEEKSHKLAYELCMRIIYRGQHPTQARMRIQAIAASFKQFNTTYMNGFTHTILPESPLHVDIYRARHISKKSFICNIEEVASLYHLPHTNVETPNILWASAKTAEPPATLPLATQANLHEVSPIATTNFRGHNAIFGIPRSDRGRHLYIIGQTGTGKSGLLELLTISDIDSPYGFAIIDPHGDYAVNIMRRIPADRAQDVIYFNPADINFPIAFNPMEVYDSTLKTHTASELIGVLKRMFDSWGPRLEYILRYSLLALLDYPGATMLDITRILTDKKFRQEVLSYVKDPVVLNFWNIEFASWNDKFAAEAVAPVLNKVGAFTANPMVRNIIGQPKSSFNIREIMDQRKILIVNLSRGLIGEDNASLLGALLVTKIQMAAMSRADVDLSERVPFYLYVDEFQNFATDSFATILSEARKYALNLTVANQYTAQMEDTVKDAVFGNVGSIVSFRTSADDARIMMRYFEPTFEEHDMVHMHNRNFVVSMTIAGEKAQAFSATTINLPLSPPDHSAAIIAASRERYAFDRKDVEEFMHSRYLTSTPNKQPQQKQQRQAPQAQQPKRQPETKQVPRQAQAAPAPVVSAPEKPKVARKPTNDLLKQLSRIVTLGHELLPHAHPAPLDTPAQVTSDTQPKGRDTTAAAATPRPRQAAAEAKTPTTSDGNQPSTLPAPTPDGDQPTKKKRRRRSRRKKVDVELATSSAPQAVSSASIPRKKRERPAPKPRQSSTDDPTLLVINH